MLAMTKRNGNKWLQRLDDAQRFRREKLTDNVKRYLELYKGNHWGNLGSDRRKDLITVNMIFPMIRNQIGYYYYRDPKIFVHAADDRSVVTAPLMESVLNYEWRERNVRRQQRFKIYDTLLFGHSVSEAGWQFESDIVKVKGKDERISYEEYIRKDHPYIKRLSPLRFLFDSKAEMDPITTSEFVAKEFFVSVDDVKNNPQYTNTDQLDETQSGSNDREKERYGEDVLKMIEVHDRKHMKLLVFAMGYDEPLLEEDHPYEDILEGHNFNWLQFNHVPDEPFGVSQIALIEDQQHELNRTRTQMFRHRRRVSNRRYLFEEGSITDAQISKLEDAEGGAMVQVGNINAIKPLDDARMSGDVPLIESIIKQDIRELTGLPAAQFGVIDNQSRSATEMSMIEGAKNMRNDDNLVLVEEDTRDSARKMAQLLMAFSDREKIIKIVGPLGVAWHKYTKEDIQGEYDFTIDPGSTTKMSDAVRRKQSVDLMNVLLPVPGMNKRKLITDVLKSFEAQNVDQYFNPQFDQIHGGAPQPAPGNNTPAMNGQNLQEGVPTATSVATNAVQTGGV